MAADEKAQEHAGTESMQLAEGMNRISSNNLRPETLITPISQRSLKCEHVRVSDTSYIFK